MLSIKIKKLFEEVERRQIQIDFNNRQQFISLPQMLNFFDSDARGQNNDKEFDNLLGHQFREQAEIYGKFITTNQNKTEKIQVQPKKQKNSSETYSLSLITEQKSEVKLTDSLYWFQLFGKNEKFFQPTMFNKNYIKIQKLNENYQFDDFSNLIIDQSYNAVLYQGMNIEDNCPIAIKEIIVKKDYIEQTKQYIIHSEIYDLYPNMFLKILLPVYVESITPEVLQFSYSMERGEINLFQYSQENKINDDEYQMIFRQLYNQVMLLHHHKIAHRDIKPQNIIFVKNKGWLLCDFEEALKYEKASSIYNIRGTYGFIPTTIQQALQIGDVLLQQDLLYNDLYALGITLLVIKHQVKKSSDIEDYLDQQDEIIKKLLQNSLLHNYVQIDSYIQYIEPNLNKLNSINSINSQKLNRRQIIEYAYILRLNGIDKTLPFMQQIIHFLDDQITKNDIKDELYLCICQQIYYCPVYINQFKNIPSLKTYRSIRFWKQKFKSKDNSIKVRSIGFMAQLGFFDLVLQFGMQYLNNEYNFAIHMVIIYILVLLLEKERALNEFELLLKFREQYYMNDCELRLLIETSLSILDPRLFDKSELDYFGAQPVKMDVNKIQINLEDDDEVICQSFMNQCQTQQNTAMNFWYDQTMTQNVKEQIIDVYRLSLNDKLNDQINKVHKYYSTAFHYQNSLKESIINKTLLSNSQQLRRIRKQMNYLLIHNSESKHQYQIINLLKQSAILYNKQIGKPIRQTALVKLSIIILKFSQLPYQYYKHILIEELQFILFEQLYDLDLSILKLVILSTNLIDQGLKVCEQIKFKQLIYFLFLILRRTKNYRRVKKLNNKEITLNIKHMKYQNLLLKGKIKQIRILRKQHELLQKEFLLDQYLNRGY